ncbi:uncharacterized protein LOC127082359 [Lathyrus oleraceus]|uniref:uncharacterized protein LOC127082359 n=1 Tax=Pisum sativum TaxID=3888 RepID=UPI0021D0841E|nr:uncharacterized protein LOC127082359 [Pisum sativum]
MDFITGLPPSNSYTVILVVVDRLSKYSHFIPLKADYNSHKVAEVFLHTIVKLHGFPKTIVSDRDRVFTSQFWQQLFKLSGTTLSMSTAYHPQTDGQSEALLTERDDTLASLKANLMRAQQIMKKFADNKRRFVEFKVGDMVLVKLQPYRQHSIALRRNQKLSMCYFGPFPVMERIGQVAYRMMLPTTAKIHPVFHVSALKLCKGDHHTQLLPLPLTTTEQGPLILPHAIVNHRTVIQNGQPIQQVQVQWDTLPTEVTWENWDELKVLYPNLEDKVLVNEGSNVMSWQNNTVGGKGQIISNEEQMANDPNIVEPRRGKRVKIPNRKYSACQHI